MKLGGFLSKTVANRKFDYQPMYYNERKERLKAKAEQYKRVENGDLSDEERKSIFRDNMRGEWSRSEVRSKQRSTSNFRIIILILIILALGYFIFNGVDQVDTIVEKLY